MATTTAVYASARRRARGTALRQAAGVVVLGMIAVATVVPFLFMISTSFTESYAVMSYPPRLIPPNPSLDNYLGILTFKDGIFYRWFFNTALVTVVGTGIALILNSLAGYVFAKKEFVGRDFLFALILSTLMVPGAVTLLPSFKIIRDLGMYNTYLALIVPSMATVMGIFLMRQFIGTLPTELIEAATIDGCGELGIFRRIILPLCKPPLGAMGIFLALGHWNAFLWPLVATRTGEMRTLTVGLATMRTETWINYGLVMAGATLTLLPILLFYLFFQRYFIEGLRLGVSK
jgi:multiple sugar transport system permease protein